MHDRRDLDEVVDATLVEASEVRVMPVVCGLLARQRVEGEVERYGATAGISWRLVRATRSALSWELELEVTGSAGLLDRLAGMLYREVPGYSSTGERGSTVKRIVSWLFDAATRGMP